MHQTISERIRAGKEVCSKILAVLFNKPVYRTACGKQVHTTPSGMSLSQTGLTEFWLKIWI